MLYNKINKNKLFNIYLINNNKITMLYIINNKLFKY